MATRRSGANHRSAGDRPVSIAGSMMWNSIRTAKSPCFRVTYRYRRHPASAAQPRAIPHLHRSLLSDLPLGGAAVEAAFYGRSGRRTISCQFNDLPRKSLTRPGWWCLTIRIINRRPRYAGAVRQRAAVCSSSRVPILHDLPMRPSAARQRCAAEPLLPAARKHGGGNLYFFKTFNMAGWRFGFAVGNASIIRAFKKLHTHSYSTVFGAIQDAAIAALNRPDGLRS